MVNTLRPQRAVAVLLTAGLAGLLLHSALCPGGGQIKRNTVENADVLASKNEFADAPVVRRDAGNKLVQTTLEVKLSEQKIQHYKVKLRTYNGKLIGPTIRVRPG